MLNERPPRRRDGEFLHYIGRPPYWGLAWIVTHPSGRRLRFRDVSPADLRMAAAERWGEPAIRDVYERYGIEVDPDSVNGREGKRRPFTRAVRT